MADSVLINHPFVSMKPNSSDGSIVSSTAWNAADVISGGSAGQMLVRNPADPQGASWVHGPQITFAQANHNGAAPSPFLCTIVITFTSVAAVQLAVMASIVTADASAGTVQLYRDGVLVSQETVNAQGHFVCTRVQAINENAGTHTYALKVTSGGAVITSSTTQLTIFSVGRL